MKTKTSNATRSTGPSEKPRSRAAREARSVPLPSGHLDDLAAMVNSSPQVQAQAQLKGDIRHSPQMRGAQDLLTLSAEINHHGQPSGTSAGEVAQCLMQGAVFLGRYKHAGTANTRAQIGKLLTD